MLTVAADTGIWDDRYSATIADFGGHCILNADIEEFRNDSAIEVLHVTLANDGGLDGLALHSDVNLRADSVLCLRPATQFTHMMIPAFGEQCVEGIDHGLYLEYQVCQLSSVAPTLLHCQGGVHRPRIVHGI